MSGRFADARSWELTADGLDLVVPSAHGLELLDQTLPALASALDAAHLRRSRVVICDDAPDPRPELAVLVSGLGFRVLATGGVGAGPARNLGAATGRAPWLAFMDDDVQLDPGAFATIAGSPPPVRGLLGGLRPPDGSPEWLRWTYEDAVLTTASAMAGPALLEFTQLSSALCVLRRDDFETVGGFPATEGWGGEDVLLGMALRERFPGRVLRRVPAFGGIHHHLPTFDGWLDRRAAAGEQLARLERQLSPTESAELLRLFGHLGGPRSRLKAAAGHLPLSLLRCARGRTGRRLAAAAMEARGLRRARLVRG